MEIIRQLYKDASLSCIDFLIRYWCGQVDRDESAYSVCKKSPERMHYAFYTNMLTSDEVKKVFTRVQKTTGFVVSDSGISQKIRNNLLKLDFDKRSPAYYLLHSITFGAKERLTIITSTGECVDRIITEWIADGLLKHTTSPQDSILYVKKNETKNLKLIVHKLHHQESDFFSDVIIDKWKEKPFANLNKVLNRVLSYQFVRLDELIISACLIRITTHKHKIRKYMTSEFIQSFCENMKLEVVFVSRLHEIIASSIELDYYAFKRIRQHTFKRIIARLLKTK